jgi:Ca2+-binding RTX toxin-like protein
LLLCPSYPDCNHNPDFSHCSVQVWAAPPNGGQPGTLTAAFANGASADGGRALDIPSIAASLVTPGLFALGYNDNTDNVATLATYQRNSGGTYALPDKRSLVSTFPNLAFDLHDDLYVATVDLSVARWTRNGTGWSVATSGKPPVVGSQANTMNITVPATQPFLLDPMPRPALAVSRIGGASDTIVYTAFETVVNGVRTVQLNAANAKDLSAWVSPTPAPAPPNSLAVFHPSLSVDANNDVLDLVAMDIEGRSGDPLSALALKTYFYRFDAAAFSLLMGPASLNVSPPSLAQLPTRHSNEPTQLFAGEYLGLATSGLTAVTAFSDVNNTAANVDLGWAQVTEYCTQALALIDPDNTWQCSCFCGPGEGSHATVVGCASASATTASAACAQVCLPNLCGTALSCSVTACQGTSAGNLVSTGTCAVSDGVPAGAPPSSASDFTATNDGTSTAVIHTAGTSSTSALNGSVFFNVSTSPPTANAQAEIALLSLAPADVFVGGNVNATVRNIKLVHRSRIYGTFTDATHFTLPTGSAEVALTLQTQPTGGALSAPVNVRAANQSPLAGVLNLGANAFSIDGTIGDNSGNALDIHFHGAITSRPPDSNGNGIIDAVDTCPGETVGPDRTAPVFTFVPPAMTITTCSGVNIGRAQATDPCGVTITNNAPSVFPLGTTTVTWTARDGAGNVAEAVQLITAVLGDTASCCPAGSHVIIGTSGNDVLTGTSGPDCILGLGGQDTINGLGGDDVISGGDGDDVIYGQDGNDRLYGGAGQDTIYGGPGSNFIDGGDGDDHLYGDAGADTIYGGQGKDVMYGYGGNDILYGGDDDDQVFGGDGDDVLVGGLGNDTLKGEAGNDTIYGQSGDDHLDGGTGMNLLDGGAGHDICVDNGMTLLVCPTEGD